MAIRADSYGSVDEVTVFCQFVLRGESGFNANTHPSLLRVEKMIDRVSGQINVALHGCGLTPSAVYANSTAKLMLDDFVVKYTSGEVELTQPGVGFNSDEGTRFGSFIKQTPRQFIAENCMALKEVVGSVTRPTSAGVAFTGIDKRSQRDDPDDTSREQPLFRRHQFDNPGLTDSTEEDDD